MLQVEELYRASIAATAESTEADGVIVVMQVTH